MDQEPTINLGAILAKNQPTGVQVDAAAELRKGVMRAQKDYETAKYGTTLPDPGLTAGRLNDLITKISVASYTGKEEPKTVPDAPEPVTLPQEDTKHQQHAAVEQDYLSGKISHKDYIDKANKIYGIEPPPQQLDTSKYLSKPGDPSRDKSHWDPRPDGTRKGDGFLGLLKRPDGRVSSEISMGFEIDGKEMDIPTMVPGLTQAELDYLMTHDVKSPDFAKNMPQSIKDKAVAHAKQRRAEGKSVFHE